MRKRNIVKGNSYNGKDILEYKHRDIGMDSHILETIDEHLKDSLERHSKVLVVRFDVRFPEDFSNKSFSKFQAEFMRKERRAGYDPSYVAVREIGEREGNPRGLKNKTNKNLCSTRFLSIKSYLFPGEITTVW